MDRTDFIKTRDDVIHNIKTLYSYLGDKSNGDTFQWATSIFKNGRIYVIEIINSHVCFAPSRFVGYRENTVEKHQKHHGNGNQTNAVLESFYQRVRDERLDLLFQKELAFYGLTSDSKNYWIPKGTTIDEILQISCPPKVNYWIGRVTSDEYWSKAVDNHIWLTQQRYGQQTNSAVTNLLQCVKEIKVNDVILLTYENGIFAYGNVIKCTLDSNQISSLTDVISNNKHEFTEGIVKFKDNDVFYEDLRDGCDSWGQRIMVDEWHYLVDSTNVNTSGMRSEITQGVTYMSIIGVSEQYAKMKINELKKQYERKYMFITDIAKLLKEKHNIILQGAPGTGKTYNTAAIALATLGITDVDLSDHQKVMDRYEQLRFDKNSNPNGQIGFCTFHQSMDYEDFVEGIKIQKQENGTVSYEIEDGIFKCISERAKENFDLSKKSNDEIKIEIRTRDIFDNYCEDLQSKLNETDFVELYPKSKMKIRKVNFKSDGTALSIGIAKDENSDCQSLTWEIISRDYNDFKSSKIQSYLDIKPRYESKSSFHGNAIYYFELYKKMYEFEKSLNLPENEPEPTTIEKKNYVLIIDEINRGNVSKIFGELITLLESDKRDGADHPISVTLPYSKTLFKVPQNLYIIGTMNTTDRSTGTLDYALRRRFAFVTLKAKEDVITNHYKKIGKDALGEVAVTLFKNIRDFINDPKHLCGDFDIDDLMVGHSYFMAKSEDKLRLKIKYEVIPLINEYINDGILRVGADEKNTAFSAWEKLATISDKNEEIDLEEAYEGDNEE